jgi:hypothetical protein
LRLARICWILLGTISIYEAVEFTLCLTFTAAGIPIDGSIACKKVAVESAFLNRKLRCFVGTDCESVVWTTHRDGLGGIMRVHTSEHARANPALAFGIELVIFPILSQTDTTWKDA